jgi:drug/metabolite transporter (DMT)-like permease
VLSYIDPAAAIILAALSFLQLPTGYELVGVVLILGAAFLSEIKIPKKIKRR